MNQNPYCMPIDKFRILYSSSPKNFMDNFNSRFGPVKSFFLIKIYDISEFCWCFDI